MTKALRPPRTLREKKIRLREFHDRIAALKFLDPACGCGNFLLIAYRELRRLEMDVLEELHKDDPSMVLDVSVLCKVTVSQFYGIEIEQFPAEIAKVALWLMDHLCNLEVADRFGQYFARIPIKASPHIVCANALQVDWGTVFSDRINRIEDTSDSHAQHKLQYSHLTYRLLLYNIRRFVSLGRKNMGKEQELFAEMASIETMFRGSISKRRQGKSGCEYFAVQCWHNGKNECRYVPPARREAYERAV